MGSIHDTTKQKSTTVGCFVVVVVFFVFDYFVCVCFDSVPMCGHCASFSPLHEHTGERHSLLTNGFRCFLKCYFTAIAKGVIALNVVCLKR